MSANATFVGPLWGSTTPSKPTKPAFMGPFLGSPTESEANENISIKPRGLGEQDLHQDIKSKNLLVRGTWQDLLALHQQKESILKAPHHGSST